MQSSDFSPSFSPIRQPRFATTRWSLVVRAGGCATEESHAALTELCQIYWYPLYAYLRRRGLSCDDAQDATQEFIAALLDKGAVARADSRRGRFRSFLLASLKNFLANEQRKARAQKRGPQQKVLSLDFAAGERQLAIEPAHHLTPERLYERRWALLLLERVVCLLRDEYAAAGKEPLFNELQAQLGAGHDRTPYTAIAHKLGTTEGAIKVAVHRLRRRYRELLRAEVAQTVQKPEDVEDELRSLLKAVSL
jgi:RNA polymerase sigma factor (sigma-70 family)